MGTKQVNMKTLFGQIVIVFIVIIASSLASADEGMWLYNDMPYKLLKERYGFKPSKAWLEHIQKSSVRFNSGGSGSFISKDGLILSNHHVGADALQKFSDAEHNYLRDGFYASSSIGSELAGSPGPLDAGVGAGHKYLTVAHRHIDLNIKIS